MIAQHVAQKLPRDRIVHPLRTLEVQHAIARNLVEATMPDEVQDVDGSPRARRRSASSVAHGSRSSTIHPAASSGPSVCFSRSHSPSASSAGRLRGPEITTSTRSGSFARSGPTACGRSRYRTIGVVVEVARK